MRRHVNRQTLSALLLQDLARLKHQYQSTASFNRSHTLRLFVFQAVDWLSLFGISLQRIVAFSYSPEGIFIMIVTTGQTCPQCKKGTLLVSSTRIDRRLQMRFRYLRCNTCDYKPAHKIAVPLEFAPPRPPKPTTNPLINATKAPIDSRQLSSSADQFQ